jgi:hypothetical protein
LSAPDNPSPEPTAGLRLEGPPPAVDMQRGYQPNVGDLLKQQHAKTAGKLAGWLVGILGGSIILQYACLMFLIMLKRDDGVKVLEDVFHSWLPVLAGLAGGAATYYFTKEGK